MEARKKSMAEQKAEVVVGLFAAVRGEEPGEWVRQRTR